jgi:hypothetical protein
MKKINIPNDVNNQSVQRAMGTPVVSPKGLKVGSDTEYVDLMDLSGFDGRLFNGISIKNKSSVVLDIGMGVEGNTDRDIEVEPNTTVFYDNQSFGPFSEDHTKESRVTHIRAICESALGTPASATIVYPVAIPADQETIEVNGKIYEFSNDMSKDPSHDVIVAIGVNNDVSWTNMANAINANEQAVSVSIDTGTNTITITSNYGGDYGDGLVVQDGANPTGATFSGNLAGGTGGGEVVVHVW